MNERRIESVSSLPWGMSFWSLIFLVSVATGMVLGNRHFYVFSLGPGLLALGFWFTRLPKIAFDITDEGLRVENPPQEIAFDSINSIWLNGRPQDFRASKLKPGRLTIIHEGGCLQIPARLSVSVVEVYRYLGEKVPVFGEAIIGAELLGHYEKETEMFGSERVFAFSARRWGRLRSSRLRLQVCLCLMMICGILWAICGGTFLAPPRHDISPWLPLGVICAIFSGLFWILAAAGSIGARVQKKLQNASLIISPSGIALSQGDLKGQLRWNELRDIRLRPRAGNFAVSSENDIRGLPGIQLIVPGVTIDIPDIYNRPLPLIHRLLLHYWKGDEPNPGGSGSSV